MKTKSIVIKSLTLRNFKGIQAMTIDLREQSNFIRGENATGKTTIMDAFLWQLFGKDSSGRTDFNIKPLHKTGEPVHNLECEVSSTLLINNETISLRRIYKEKWTKPRGQKDLVFSGHETDYYYNEVPLSQKDYNVKIELICPEKIFRLLTNPHHFTSLNWTDQRQMLISVAGRIDDNDIASGNQAFIDLLASLGGRKSLDELKLEVASKKKIIRDSIETIPARIDEVDRMVPPAADWKKIESDISEHEKNIRKVDAEIANTKAGVIGDNSARHALIRQIDDLKASKEKFEREATAHVDNMRYEYSKALRLRLNNIRDIEDSINQGQGKITGLVSTVQALKKRREEKLEEWRKINEETLQFNQEGVCPTCGQSFPAEYLSSKRSDAEAKFNISKAAKLEYNVSEGKKIAAEILDAETKISATREAIEKTQGQLEEIKAVEVPEPNDKMNYDEFLKTTGYNAICKSIEEKEVELSKSAPEKTVDTTEAESRKSSLQAVLNDLRKELNKREQIISLNQRKSDLQADQQRLAQELADLEKVEFTIASFNRAKIDMVEERINKLFRIVRFKMFNRQINGNDAETCECMVDGVPYSDLNNAMKINAGIDILSALSLEYGIAAPIFIDNRESVNELLPVRSQMINLVVTTDKELVFN